MFHGKIRSYFLFTKKERRGIISLVILIIVLFLIPDLYEFLHKKPDGEKIKRFNEEISKWIAERHSDSTENGSDGTEDSEINDTVNRLPAIHAKEKISLFYFDPNKISTSDWKKLGVSDHVIQTIQHYLSRGGRFNRPEDLKKIYGLREEEYRRLFPFVKIQEHFWTLGSTGKFDTTGKKISKSIFPGFELRKEKLSTPVNINVADTSELMSLRGIGSKLARRIVNYRDKLGGFYSIDQIAETYALSDSVFRQIRPRLMIGTKMLRKLDINHAELDELKSHPYIRWNLARAIVEYRNQHGSFRSLEDLKRLNVVSPENYQKLVPYLTLDSL